MKLNSKLFSMLVAVMLSSCSPQQPKTETTAEPTTEKAKPTVAVVKSAVGNTDYSAYVDKSFPNRVYWGVAHVHTGFSFDAGMFGITLTPDDLFRVATGGEVVMD
jgi:hypothetical protein